MKPRPLLLATLAFALPLASLTVLFSPLGNSPPAPLSALPALDDDDVMSAHPKWNPRDGSSTGVPVDAFTTDWPRRTKPAQTATRAQVHSPAMMGLSLRPRGPPAVVASSTAGHFSAGRHHPLATILFSLKAQHLFGLIRPVPDLYRPTKPCRFR